TLMHNARLVWENEVLITGDATALRPTKASAVLVDLASPEERRAWKEGLSATMLEEPPGAVTAPMTWPPTPSPVEAGADCLTVARLSPSWVLVAAAAGLITDWFVWLTVHVSTLMHNARLVWENEVLITGDATALRPTKASAVLVDLA